MALEDTFTVIRAAVDTAGQTSDFEVGKYPVQVSLFPIGDLTVAEFADLQVKDSSGTFGDLADPSYQGSGGQVRLSTVATTIIIDAPGTYRLDFDNPTNAVGAYINEVRTNK